MTDPSATAQIVETHLSRLSAAARLRLDNQPLGTAQENAVIILLSNLALALRIMDGRRKADPIVKGHYLDLVLQELLRTVALTAPSDTERLVELSGLIRGIERNNLNQVARSIWMAFVITKESQTIRSSAAATRDAGYTVPERNNRFDWLMDIANNELERMTDHDHPDPEIRSWLLCGIIETLKLTGSPTEQLGKLMRIGSAFHIGGRLPEGMHRTIDRITV